MLVSRALDPIGNGFGIEIQLSGDQESLLIPQLAQPAERFVINHGPPPVNARRKMVATDLTSPVRGPLDSGAACSASLDKTAAKKCLPNWSDSSCFQTTLVPMNLALIMSRLEKCPVRNSVSVIYPLSTLRSPRRVRSPFRRVRLRRARK